MSPTFQRHPLADFRPTTSSTRRRLYGLGVIVALAFMVIAHDGNVPDGAAPIYLPLAGASILALCLAGVEFTLYLQQLAQERQAQMTERLRDEERAVERQRSFNFMWQELVNGRGDPAVMETVVAELIELFNADLVAVWSADTTGVFHLCDAGPKNHGGAGRLNKVAQTSPCFELLQGHKRWLRITANFERQTSKAFAWFCEEHEFRQVVLAPVLVRENLVGVLAFFYKENLPLSAKLTEEMQSAAHLFLCAL